MPNDDKTPKDSIRIVGTSYMQVTQTFVSPTIYTVTLTLREPLPPEMPQTVAEAMLLSIISEHTRLESANLSDTAGVKAWKTLTTEEELSEDLPLDEDPASNNTLH